MQESKPDMRDDGNQMDRPTDLPPEAKERMVAQEDLVSHRRGREGVNGVQCFCNIISCFIFGT